MNDEIEVMTPDEVCEKYADKGVRVTIRDLDEEDILFEGTRDGLLFLSELFRAQALDEVNDDKHIHPRGAGRTFFTKNSTRGIFILLRRE